MIRNLHIIEWVDFEYYDEKDDENVEERYVIGYFTDLKIYNEALKLCYEKKRSSTKIIERTIRFECSNNQKFVYVLWFDYSIIVDGKYVDYYYYFEPQSNINKCYEQKKQLQLNPRYIIDDSKITYASKDGFYVDKYLINRFELEKPFS